MPLCFRGTQPVPMRLSDVRFQTVDCWPKVWIVNNIRNMRQYIKINQSIKWLHSTPVGSAWMVGTLQGSSRGVCSNNGTVAIASMSHWTVLVIFSSILKFKNFSYYLVNPPIQAQVHTVFVWIKMERTQQLPRSGQAMSGWHGPPAHHCTTVAFHTGDSGEINTQLVTVEIFNLKFLSNKSWQYKNYKSFKWTDTSANVIHIQKVANVSPTDRLTPPSGWCKEEHHSVRRRSWIWMSQGNYCIKSTVPRCRKEVRVSFIPSRCNLNLSTVYLY